MRRISAAEPNRLNLSDYTALDPDFTVKHSVVDQNTSVHWHDYCEIEFVVGGRAKHVLNGIESEIGAGAFYFLTPADFHEFTVLEPVELFNISFNDSLIPAEYLHIAVASQNSAFTVLKGAKKEYMRHLMARLEEEYRSFGKYKESCIKGLLSCIFTEIAYSCIHEDTAKTDITADPIRKVLLYLHCNFRENPSLSKAAKTANLSENYFCDLFHKVMGQKYNRYLNDLKLKYAYNLVVSSDASVTDICFASGFESLSHFQKEFRTRYGCCARDLRKSKRPI